MPGAFMQALPFAQRFEKGAKMPDFMSLAIQFWHFLWFDYVFQCQLLEPFAGWPASFFIHFLYLLPEVGTSFILRSAWETRQQFFENLPCCHSKTALITNMHPIWHEGLVADIGQLKQRIDWFISILKKSQIRSLVQTFLHPSHALAHFPPVVWSGLAQPAHTFLLIPSNPNQIEFGWELTSQA